MRNYFHLIYKIRAKNFKTIRFSGRLNKFINVFPYSSLRYAKSSKAMDYIIFIHEYKELNEWNNNEYWTRFFFIRKHNIILVAFKRFRSDQSHYLMLIFFIISCTLISLFTRLFFCTLRFSFWWIMWRMKEIV